MSSRDEQDREYTSRRPTSRILIYLIIVGAVALFLHFTQDEQQPRQLAPSSSPLSSTERSAPATSGRETPSNGEVSVVEDGGSSRGDARP